MNKSAIKVWCEYDISGSFGGNNNEQCLLISDQLTQEEIDNLVIGFVSRRCGLDKEDLEDLYDWQYIVLDELK